MPGIEIIVIDGSDDSVLKTDRIIHPGALVVRSVSDMVAAVLARAGSRQIGRLIMWGHGSPGVQGLGIGPDFSALQTSQARLLGVPHDHLANRTELNHLIGHFAPDAVVELHGCNVAQHHSGRELLRQLSDLWSVRVRAAVMTQPSDRINRYFGPVVEAGRLIPGHNARVHLVPVGVPWSTPEQL